MELKTLKPWLSIREKVHVMNPVNILEIMGMDPDAPYFSSDDFK
jgi:nucleolar protein 14